MKIEFSFKSLIFFILTNTLLFAQNSNNSFISTDLRNYGLITRSWNINNGLPGDRIYDFIKDKEGFLWLATNQGLARFDGSEFKVFNDQNVSVLKDGFYSDLLIDKNENLYFFNDNRIIKKNKENKFVSLTSKLPGSELLSGIVLDSSEKLWVETVANGLFEIKNNKLMPVNPSLGISANHSSTLLVDKTGEFWIGTNTEGIYKYINGKFVKIFDQIYLPSKHIRSLFIDSFNRLWVGTNGGTVFFENINGVSNPSVKFITKEIILTIAEDADHNIWMGSVKNGIYIYNNKNILRFTTENDLSDNNITKINVDENNIWVGTLKGGINLIRKSQIFSIEKKEGLIDDYVNSIFEDKDGSILIGTTSGIYKSISPLSNMKVTKLNYLKEEHILAMKRDHTANLIIGTRYNGLFIINNKGIANYNSNNGLNANFVRCLYIDADNTIWIGTNGGGVSILNSGKFRELTRKEGLSNDLISFIHKSKNGKYWIGTSGGGVNVIDKNGKIKIINEATGLSGNVISSINEEENGNIWLTINGGGISLIRGDKINNFTAENGLYSNVILNMVPDKQNNFWLSTPRGVFSVKRSMFFDFIDGKVDKLKYQYFDKSDGMASSRCAGASPQTAIITKNGIALFSTVNGLVEIKPSLIKKTSKNISLYFNNILVNNEPVNLIDLTNIEPNPDRIEFSFGAINFENPSKVEFRCLLEDVDKSWIELGKNKSVGYSHLPFGNYRFKLIGYDPGDNKVLASSEISFFIKPYLWETLPAQIIFAFCLILFLIFITRYINKRKYEQKIKSLEAEKALEKERIRISADMHDEFGASLSKISLLSEIAKKNIEDKNKTEKLVNEISESGRTLAASMDEIVWAVNPKNDRLDKMLYYISSYFENHLSLTDIKFKVKIPEEIPSVFISAEIRHNIFSVIKEGINNTIKHSGASEIQLAFNYSENNLKIELIDDGRGIDFEKITEFNNGIPNMKKRIADIGGRLNITNKKEGGVLIDINLTI